MKNKNHIFLTIIGFVLLIGVIYMSIKFIGALSLGIFIYYSTRPSYRFFKKYFSKTISAFLAQITFIIPSLILIIYSLQLIAFEVRSFTNDLTERIDNIIGEKNVLDKLLSNEELNEAIPIIDFSSDENNSASEIIEELDTNTISEIVDVSLDTIAIFISSITGLFFTLFIAFSLSFYLQRDGHKIKESIYRHTDYDKNVTEFMERLDRDFKVVFIGNIVLAIGTAILASTIYFIMSIFLPNGDMLTFPILLGLLCGAASLIPVIGMKIIYFPVTGLLLLNSIIGGFTLDALILPLVFFIISLFIIDGIPDFIARPYIGSLGGVSTGILLFSYILGPIAFGWFGLFLGPIIFIGFYEFYICIVPEILN